MASKKRASKLTFLASLILTSLLHIILLFNSSQIMKFEKSANSEQSQKMIVEIKMVGIEDADTPNKLLLQNNSEKSKRSQTAPQSSPSPDQQETQNKKGPNRKKTVKIKTFKYANTSSLNKMLPMDLRNTSFSRANSQIALEIPEGVPEDQLNQLNSVLYSFYQRVGKQFINTLIDKYYESGRTNPHWQIPENEQRDKVTLRATYDRDGNVIRVRTLTSARYKTHSVFFLNAINEIQKIPNPPEVLLNSSDEFSINYSLNLNERR